MTTKKKKAKKKEKKDENLAIDRHKTITKYSINSTREEARITFGPL